MHPGTGSVQRWVVYVSTSQYGVQDSLKDGGEHDQDAHLDTRMPIIHGDHSPTISGDIKPCGVPHVGCHHNSGVPIRLHHAADRAYE